MKHIKLTKDEYTQLGTEIKKRKDLKFCVITRDKDFYENLRHKDNVIVFYSEGFYNEYIKRH
jgi:hypothetical protein